MMPNPYDWPAADFLILYVALFVIAALVSGVGPALVRPAGRETPVGDPALLARLAGGRARLAEALVAGRLVRGDLCHAGRAFTTTDGSSLDWKKLSRQLAPETERAERRLRADGLLVDEDTHGVLRRWAALPFVALAAFGLVRLALGIARERPVGFLVMLLVATVIVALIRWFGVDPRTAAADPVVRRTRATHDRLRRAPTRDEMALGVALFGTAVLAGSEYAPFHQLRTSSADSGSGSDGGGGEGGCGGGGCGGCGG